MKLNRRKILKGAAAVFAPAIIGRAAVSTARAAFEGEQLIVVSWSGNHELSFRSAVIEPFNAKYGTKAETVGGWDQMVSQIVAAPADNPPFDITIADEYTTSAGLAEKIFLKTDRSKIPGFSAVHPWFDETRGEARDYGVPFGGGSLWMLTARSTGMRPDSWKNFWAESVRGKTTMDAAAFYWDLCIPAILSDAKPGIDEVFGTPEELEPLFLELEKLKMAKWYKDGAELANLMLQDEAQVAMMYSADAHGFIKEHGAEFEAAIPKEGTASYTNWFMKVRGTRHAELADLFMAYLMEQETQQRFLDVATDFMSRSDLKAPPHWPNYPASNEDMARMFSLFSLKGWEIFGAHWDALDARMKTTIARTTEG
ncbi:PotD/PotF family extracellular solute-binding protein [Aestuariivirga sp.]|uniref:ABC transporter substrate-binding protein n=1 Tax=Aestuariivirga sp. TaxID=2650926 RepID=UPI00391B8B0B